jgi:type I restriction enzyme S subunit
LESELEARKKQYDYYRNELLNFEGKKVEWKTLRDVTSLITKGTTPKAYTQSGVSFIKTEAFDGPRIDKNKLSYIDDITHQNFLKRSILESNDILFTIAGATIGKIAIVTDDILPANTNQALAIIRLFKGVNTKYIFYILRSNYMRLYINQSVKGSAQPNLNLQQLNDFQIPLPSLTEQERIVGILDKFDALVNDISMGLPAEIAARRKHYEYYRGKLLNFKSLNH